MKTFLMILSVALIAVAPLSTAQPEGRSQPPREAKKPEPQQDRMRDRDMQKDSDRTMQRSRDRIHMPDEVYGRQLLSAEEQQRFREEMRNANTVQERREIANRHRELILQRAEERGVGLDNQPLFGRQLMSATERRQMREEMMNAESVEERERIRAEHRERMLQRAREQGVDIDNGDGN